MTKNIKITTEYITLTQLLKEENIISSGGQAKYYLMDFPVLLNGETENRRGKKLYNHDEITVDGENYVISLADNADEMIAAAQEEKAERAAAAKKPCVMTELKHKKLLSLKNVKRHDLLNYVRKTGHVQVVLVDLIKVVVVQDQKDLVLGTPIAKTC
ncbi:hypothetical protein GCM10025884_09490 [Leuconostoc gelidum subsp. gelidum]|nr:hypothetical protein GCM10025884_09490 [Leuconostoc gelidum subsp. gelidum]